MTELSESALAAAVENFWKVQNYTGTASPLTVKLGWKPQYIMIKTRGRGGSWNSALLDEFGKRKVAKGYKLSVLHDLWLARYGMELIRASELEDFYEGVAARLVYCKRMLVGNINLDKAYMLKKESYA